MSHIKLELDFRAYLHEKAQESRQNEIQACLMFVAGALFFVSGILVNLNLASNPKWFIFIPYQTEPLAGAVLGLSLIVSGLSLMVFGIVVVIRNYHERKWFMEELRKAYTNKQMGAGSLEELQVIEEKHSKAQTPRVKSKRKTNQKDKIG